MLEPQELRSELWGLAHEVASLSHPWFRSVIDKRITREQVIQGEIQHFLRVMHNKDFFGAILENAKREGDQEIIKVAQENYDEEVVGDGNHTDLLFRLLDEAGIDRALAEKEKPTAGTAIAIESIIGFCQRHSALEGMAFVAFVEAQNAGEDGVAYQVFRSLVDYYGFSEYAADTFRVHSVEDEKHGNKQIELICRKANTPELQEKIRRAVFAGTRTFSVEWDGHLQASLGSLEYWGGA